MTSPGHNGGPLGEGWIARHRSVREHWLVGHGIYVKPADPSRKRCLSQGEAWEDMLMECRYADGFVENAGRKMRIERGSVVGAVSWLAHRWNWTPQTVRTFLDKLEADGMIMRHVPGASDNNKHVGKVSTIISVCNYDRYQNPDFDTNQSKQQTNNRSPANEPQTSNNIYKDNKGTREQEESPPNPHGGMALRGGRSRSKSPFTTTELATSDAAIEAWNASARQHGFVRVTVCPEKRRRRLLTRLSDIGSIENFRLALSAIPLVPFLMGKVSPRPGEAPFKFEFDHLMQTDGKLGDVLAKLIDKAASLGITQADKPWLSWDAAEWRAQIAKHANGIWPVGKLSGPPGTEDCDVPAELVDELRLIERYDQNGISRERH